MRRIVTGEQVARIYNPDPFARPVFRAPVYRTPAALILAAGALLAAGLVASFVATRLRVPSLLLFLGVGMLVGSDGLGWIQFDS